MARFYSHKHARIGAGEMNVMMNEKDVKALTLCGLRTSMIETVYRSKVVRTASIEALTRLAGLNTVVLSGPSGCGKTFAVYDWLMFEADSVNREDLLRKIGSIGPDFISRPNKVATIEAIRMDSTNLLIDNMGIFPAVNPSALFLERLESFLKSRNSRYRRTVITTNLNREQFLSRYGDRVMKLLFWNDVGSANEVNLQDHAPVSGPESTDALLKKIGRLETEKQELVSQLAAKEEFLQERLSKLEYQESRFDALYSLAVRTARDVDAFVGEWKKKDADIRYVIKS